MGDRIASCELFIIPVYYIGKKNWTGQCALIFPGENLASPTLLATSFLSHSIHNTFWLKHSSATHLNPQQLVKSDLLTMVKQTFEIRAQLGVKCWFNDGHTFVLSLDKTWNP